jgi:hypothetical protein
LIIPVNAQTDTLLYINSSFETPEDQAKWTKKTQDEVINWDYYPGGEDDAPLSAFSGNLNARFFWSDFGQSYYRDLVSEPIDLSTAQTPILSFWYAQYHNFGQDELYVLFKAGTGAPWDTVASLTEERAYWDHVEIELSEYGSKYLVENFQMAFCGYANSGHGICVDSVVMKETSIIDKFVKSYSYEEVEHALVSTPSTQAPLIRLRIEITGNNGDALLNSISYRLNEGDDSYFESNGFKLYKTNSNLFKNIEDGSSTQIGSSVSISSGVVTFSGLSENLKIGNNYIWLSADIVSGIDHNTEISFGVDANSFSVNGTTFPDVANSDIFSTHLKEAVFYDNFDSPAAWTLENDFEIGVPEGKGNGSSKDPKYAFSSSSVLGTDLSNDGLYEYNFSSPYHAVTPAIDLTYYDNVIVYMRKWNDFNPLDLATISFSTDNGTTWTPVWNSKIDNPSASSSWDEIVFGSVADEMLARKGNVRIRFSMNESNTPMIRAGFNIDNFTVCANYLDADIGIAEIISPFDDCIGFYNDTVKVVVKNYAAEPTPTNIPIYYGLWGPDSTIVTEYIAGPIGVGDSVVFVFNTLANFPRGDYYDKFFVGINMPEDEDITNDNLTKSLVIQDSYGSPVTVDFEYEGGVWIPSKNSSWECKIPDGSIPVQQSSPYAWILSPYGNYLNSDTCYVESNCFDLSMAKRNIVELDYWLLSELDHDGAAVEYSIDEGETWTLVDATPFGTERGWYTSAVSALGHNGWSGNSDGWVIAKELLPESLNTEVKVKFRVKWAADADNNGRGLAFDNFDVYPAPPDIGATSIEVPFDDCQSEVITEVSMWVTNLGYVDVPASEEIIVGYTFESMAPVIDTFLLASDLETGDSINFILPFNYSTDAAGVYNIDAYTLYEDDPWYYGTNNDTVNYSFNRWQNPISGLPDTIQSRQPDTLLLQANIEPEYSYYWDFEGTHSTDSWFDVTGPGVYYLDITESNHGCVTNDSIYVELLFNDIGVDSIISPQDDCELTSSEPVQIQIRNTGTDSLIVNDQIYVWYEFEGGPAVSDVITLTEPLHAGDVYIHTFAGHYEDLGSIGDYQMKAYAYFGGDTISANDTLDETITVHGYPTLFLGNDTTINGTEYLINVDPSFISYLWNDSITYGTRIIDTSGSYYLDVLDIHGCPASDTIDIWFKIRDISPSRLLTPVTGCDRSGSEYVRMQILNSGSDTIQVSDNIAVSYLMDGGPRHTDVITGQYMLPGATYNFNFGLQENVSALGSYDFEVTVNINDDLRPQNDTLEVEVLTDVAPDVDLGIDQPTYKVTEKVLDAGYDEDYIYLWHNGSSNQTYTVTDIENVAVLVTDTTTGCIGGDTALVYLDILDYMVTNVDLDAESCSGVSDPIDVDILNNGNLVRQGAEITLDFYLGGTFLFTEYFENIGSWPPGNIRTLTTSTPIELEESSNVVFEIEISSAGDLRTDNDDFYKNITVQPSPVVNLPGQIQVESFPYTIDAGAGYESYVWSNLSTEHTTVATQAGTYTVAVTASNGCTTVKSVYVDTNLPINELFNEKAEVSIYPNPANDFVNIDVIFDEPDTYILEVFNSQNMLILNRKIEQAEYSEQLDIQDYLPGVYFIRIRNDEISHISKMIIY